MDDVSGYPTMIDPSTGYEWGYNPETGGTFEGMDWVDWPTDGDGFPLDPPLYVQPKERLPMTKSGNYEGFYHSFGLIANPSPPSHYEAHNYESCQL